MTKLTSQKIKIAKSFQIFFLRFSSKVLSPQAYVRWDVVQTTSTRRREKTPKQTFSLRFKRIIIRAACVAARQNKKRFQAEILNFISFRRKVLFSQFLVLLVLVCAVFSSCFAVSALIFDALERCLLSFLSAFLRWFFWKILLITFAFFFFCGCRFMFLIYLRKSLASYVRLREWKKLETRK